MRRFLISLLLFLPLISCSSEESGIEIQIPEGQGTFWRYTIKEIGANESLTQTGVLDVFNNELGNFFNRSNVIEQRRVFRFDSLNNTARESIEVFNYQQNDGFVLHFFAENVFEVFNNSFTFQSLDTITAGQRNPPPFSPLQSFSDEEIGWVSAFEFSESAAASSEVMETKTYALDFVVRDTRFFGTVDVRAFSNFLDVERLSLPIKDDALAYKVQLIMTFDYTLKQGADSIDVQAFSNVLTLTDWYNEQFGLIRRRRSPFELFIPSIPSRFPLIGVSGEQWDLIIFNPAVIEEVTQP